MQCLLCGRELGDGVASCPDCAATDSCGPMASQGSQIPPGSLIAERYRIRHFAGRGGMAEVYAAQDLKLDQPVALKFLPEALTLDTERVERLLNEVRVARQVSHPNVCRVWDVGEAEGRVFLTMEWIEGEDLARRLRRCGPPEPSEGLRWARQLCAGLVAIHERGVIHRDLKPSNLMLDERGVVRITDFGLAEAARQVTGALAAEGTPSHMAPEQRAGGAVSQQTDLYALGLILQELTELPGAGPGQMMTNEIAKVIRRCLAQEPEQRPPSARAVAEVLGYDEHFDRALAEAQRRADRIQAFRAEFAELRREGLLQVPEETIAAVEHHHQRVLGELMGRFDVDISERGKQLSLGMRIASIVGALALGASGFYFFYNIWGGLTLAAQVGILVSVQLVALVVTDLLARRETSGHFTTMAAMFALSGSITSVVALGSVLNMGSSPMSFLVWATFGMLLAYGYQLRLPLVAGVLFAAIFSAGTVHSLSGGFWPFAFGHPESFLPAGVAMLALSSWPALSAHPGFGPIYRVIGLAVLLLPCVFLGQGGLSSYLPLEVGRVAVIYQLVGFLLSGLAVAAGLRWRVRDLAYTGMGFFLLQLFLRFGYWWWDWMPRYLFFLLISLTAIGILVLLKRLRGTLAAIQWGDPS